jgi:hypothetical protein
MSFHKVALRTNQMVFSNTTNSFQFDAPIPSLGAFTTPQVAEILSDDFLLVQALGGATSIDPTPPFRLSLRLNGTLLGDIQFSRWTTHLIIVPTTRIVFIPPGTLRTGGATNTLVLTPIPPPGLTGFDYFFVGPIVCQY